MARSGEAAATFPSESHATVRSVREPVADVRHIEIVPESPAQHYDPGSHIDVTVLVAGEPQIRSYSLVPSDRSDGYAIAVRVLDKGRGGSLYMARLGVGARLSISRPKNLFPLNYAAPSYLLIAGGIGITPIYAMVAALSRRAADFRLVYAGRSRSSMPFLPELEAMCGDRLSVLPDDEAGPFDSAEAIAGLAHGGEAYVCGPTPMLESVMRAWSKAERPVGNLRFETFGSSGHRPTESFQVRVPRLNLDISVPVDQTLLDALEKAGAEPLYNCKRGECGLCAVDILSLDGEIDHRDVFFSEHQKSESARMCACVSRVSGAGVVTIDLP